MLLGVAELPNPRTKVEWAKRRIQDLSVCLDTFFQARPYSVVEELNPQTGKSAYRVRILEAIPTDVACSVGDVVHNLRGALDHLLHRIMPSTALWTRSSAFPVAQSAHEYRSTKHRRLKGLPQALVDRIDLLQPYKGGNDAIWRLHELDCIDKHRLLLTFAVAHDRRWLDHRMTWLDPVPFLGVPRPRRTIIPVEDGAELMSIRHDPRVDMKEQFTFLVAFNEPQVIQPEPVVPTLLQFADLVESIIAVFDDVP